MRLALFYWYNKQQGALRARCLCPARAVFTVDECCLADANDVHTAPASQLSRKDSLDGPKAVYVTSSDMVQKVISNVRTSQASCAASVIIESLFREADRTRD